MDLHQFAADIDAQGDVTILGRVTARDATGSLSPANPQEGYLLKQADLASITLYLYDRQVSESSPVAGYPIPLTISAVIYDTIQATDIWLRIDQWGGNFSVTLAASNFPTQWENYRVRVKYITTGGGTNWGSWTLKAK